MIPAPFDYTAPTTLAEAVERLSAAGDGGRPLAGGQSLVPMLKLRLLVPDVVVDLRRIAELRGIDAGADGLVEVRALATHAEIGGHPALAGTGMVRDVVPGIGDLQVRNWGTLAGSLAHADPAADWPAVALAADVELEVVGPGGVRRVPADGFFEYAFSPRLRAGEIVTRVRLRPDRPGTTASAYSKLADLASGYALAGVAVRLWTEGEAVTDVRIAAAGAVATPVRLRSAEEALVGRPLDADTIEEAARAARRDCEPIADSAASADYRLHLLGVATSQAVTRAAARSTLGSVRQGRGRPW